MGHIISRSKAIEAIRFVTLTTKPMKAKQIFRRGHTTVVELENGALWSPTISGRYAYSPGENQVELLQMLVDLGRIPKSALVEHKAHIAAREAEDKRNEQREHFIRLLRKSGLKPSAEQTKHFKIEAYELTP